MSRTKHLKLKKSTFLLKHWFYPSGPFVRYCRRNASYRSYLTTPRGFSFWILCVSTEIWQFWCHVTYVSGSGRVFWGCFRSSKCDLFMKLWLSECLSGTFLESYLIILDQFWTSPRFSTFSTFLTICSTPLVNGWALIASSWDKTYIFWNFKIFQA